MRSLQCQQGGSSYLSAIDMPVVEPMVNHIWALLRTSPSEMLKALGLLPVRSAILSDKYTRTAKRQLDLRGFFVEPVEQIVHFSKADLLEDLVFPIKRFASVTSRPRVSERAMTSICRAIRSSPCFARSCVCARWVKRLFLFISNHSTYQGTAGRYLRSWSEGQSWQAPGS